MTAAKPRSTAYTVGSHTILQCSHTLPPLLGHCPADSYILPPTASSAFPTLVFSLRHRPSLSSSDRLRAQLFAFLTSLVELRAQRRQPIVHGDLVYFEGDTHIGEEVNKGVVLTALPPAALASFEDGLPQEAHVACGRGGRTLFCLLASAGELRMVETAGATRLLVLRAWKEAKGERRERHDPAVHFYPFPVCSDLTRATSLVGGAPPPSATPVSEAKVKVRPPERRLSQRERLQQRLRERKQRDAGLAPAAARTEDAEPTEKSEEEPPHVASLLDKLRVYKVYGSAVYREGRTVRLAVTNAAELRDAMRRVAADSARGDRRPVALSTGLPPDGESLKVWLPSASTEDTAGSLPTSFAFPVLSPSLTATPAGRVYGGFLCLFPSPTSSADEAREVEDGWTLFLSTASYAAVQQYLARGLKLAVLADSPSGLHFELTWTADAEAKGARAEEENHHLTNAQLLQHVRAYVKDDGGVHVAAASLSCAQEALARPERAAVLDYAVWLSRLVEAELKKRRNTAHSADAEQRTQATAVVRVHRDRSVQVQVTADAADEQSYVSQWIEVEALMHKVAVPTSLLAIANDESDAGGGGISITLTLGLS